MALLTGCFWVGLGLEAQALTLVSTRGRWSNVQGGRQVISLASARSAYVYWGVPLLPGGQQSGLGFMGNPSTTVEIDQVFALGRFQHLNQQILSGTAAQSATLNLTLLFQGLGIHQFQFTFVVDETPNQLTPPNTCVYPSTRPCADRITWLFEQADTQSPLMYQDRPYILELMGFQSYFTGQPTIDFISQEGGTSEAMLYARLTPLYPSQDVSEPLMTVGFGSLLLAQRWRSLRTSSSRPSLSYGGPERS